MYWAVGRKLGGDPGIGRQRGTQAVRLIGVNDDVEAAQFRQFERGIVIGGESVLRIKPGFEDAGGARVDREGGFLLFAGRQVDEAGSLAGYCRS